MNKANVMVVVPAYNEAAVIFWVIEDLVRRGYKTLVIDDCSGDETSAKAVSAGAIVIRHPLNLGQGAALQTGFEFALRQDVECIVTFDADGQHNSEDIEKLVMALYEQDAEIALGSRFLGKSFNLTYFRKLVLFWGRVFTWFTGGPWLTDVHNGIRSFRSSVLRKMQIKHPRMAHASEILYKIKANKFRYCEVPVTIRYNSYSKQKGQKSLFGIIRILWDLLLMGRN